MATLGVAACGGVERRGDDGPSWSSEDMIVEAAEYTVWDGRTGERLAPDEVLLRLGAADVVLVGEQHGERAFHRTQAQVLAVASAVGFRIAAVEWLPWHRRAAVRALGGQPVERALHELYHGLDWPRTWGHDFAAYVPALAFALERMVLEPLNARRELSKAVARGGRDAVPEDLRDEAPPLDSGSDAHRAWFADKMGVGAPGGHGGHGHAMSAETLERYYLAQLVWDETMARNTRELARAGKVVVLAGLGHTERGLGIAARLGDLKALVVRPVADEAEARERARDAGFPEREADLLWAFPASTPRSATR
ncbi:MAG: ChaN family lipoprotein [Deltaproteobacteria bacterium]|nr:ChaN family lipoprotein [Deltaproteobacteria bacterium]